MTRWSSRPAGGHLRHSIALGVKIQAATGFAFGLENQRAFTGTVGSNPTLSVPEAQSVTWLLLPDRALSFLWVFVAPCPFRVVSPPFRQRFGTNSEQRTVTAADGTKKD